MCSLAFFFTYMEVDEREKISKRNMQQFLRIIDK